MFLFSATGLAACMAEESDPETHQTPKLSAVIREVLKASLPKYDASMATVESAEERLPEMRPEEIPEATS